MGQAKLRGTFEQRKLEAIERTKAEYIAKEQARIKREQELRQYALNNPRQAAVHRNKRLLLGAMLAMSMPSFAISHNESDDQK